MKDLKVSLTKRTSRHKSNGTHRGIKRASFFFCFTVVLALCLLAAPALADAWGLAHNLLVQSSSLENQQSLNSSFPVDENSQDGKALPSPGVETPEVSAPSSADQTSSDHASASEQAANNNASVLDSGTFKGTGTAAWSLDSSGILTLSGTGEVALKVKWSRDNLSTQVKTIKVVSSSTIQPTLIDFKGFTGLTTADVSALDTSKTIDMHEAFYGDYSLMSLDLSTWKTDAVTNMEGMFGFCQKLSTIKGINSWNTSNVVYMNNMFQQCSALTSLNVSTFKTTSLKKGVSTFGLQSMFEGCSSLTELDLSGWDVSAVFNFDEMFTGCKTLKDLNLSGWKTTTATSMFDLFVGCESLTKLDLAGFNTTQVEDMSCDKMQDNQQYGLFSGCLNLSEITLGQEWRFTGQGSTQRCMFLPAPTDENLWNQQWVRLNNGTRDNPKGPAYTNDSLSRNYVGSTMADTYIWQKKSSYEVHHYQVKASGDIVENDALVQEDSAGAGDEVEAAPQNIEGYSYAAGFDNGKGDKEVQSGIVSLNPKLELKLYYTANNYTLIFDKNADDATGTMADQTRAYDDGVALTANNFERKGFLFAGWNTNSEGEGGTSYDEGDTRSVTSEPGATVVLYAQWIPSYGLVINNEDEAKTPLSNAGFELLDQDKNPLPANDFFSTANYLHPDQRIPLSTWPILSAAGGKATVYGLVTASYYLKQTVPAGYVPASFNPNGSQAKLTAQSGYQGLLDEVKITVDKMGKVTIITPDITTQKKPDKDGNINLTITYKKAPDLPVTGVLGEVSPLMLIQVAGAFLAIGAVAFVIRRHRRSL